MVFGTFASGALDAHRIGDEFLDGAHRPRAVSPGLAPQHRGGPETQRGDTPLNLDSRFL